MLLTLCYSSESLSFFHHSFSYLQLPPVNKFFSFGSSTAFYSVNSVISSHLYVTHTFSTKAVKHDFKPSRATPHHSYGIWLCLLSSGNNSTYLMSLHILWVICECELLKLRKCVTRKVLRAQYAHQRPVLFSHSYKRRVKSEQNLLCRWVIVLRGYSVWSSKQKVHFSVKYCCSQAESCNKTCIEVLLNI